MTKISIVIPAYNVEGYIDRCLQSLVDQTFSDFEVLIMDDGSSDNTGAIIDAWQQNDSRIHAFHKKNGGVSAARNDLIPKTVGKYILFYDADDHVKPDALEKLWQKAEETQSDVVLYGYLFEKLDGTFDEFPVILEKEIYDNREEENVMIKDLIPHYIGVSLDDIGRWLRGDSRALKKENTGPWKYLYRRSVIMDHNLRFDPDLKVGEDTCFITEYLSFCNKAVVLPECLYYLVERKTSVIFTYEGNAAKMRVGKSKLLAARRALTQRIEKRTGINIEQDWQGTAIMNIVQLAFAYTKKNASSSSYADWMQYNRLPETEKAIAAMPDYGGHGVKSIPFRMIQKHQFHMLFQAVRFLNMIGYTFTR